MVSSKRLIVRYFFFSLSHYNTPKCYNPTQIYTRSTHVIHNTHSNRRNRNNTSRIQAKTDKDKICSRHAGSTQASGENEL